mgnify:CR=1 FL=1
MRKPRFSDIAVFAADIAEVSDTPSVTTDVLEWIFTEHSWDTLPPSLQRVILRQSGDPVQFSFYSNEDDLTSDFYWPGAGILSHVLPYNRRNPTVIHWEERA